MSATASSRASSARSSAATATRTNFSPSREGELEGEGAVDVLAAFTSTGIRPLALRMGGRRYEPLHVHLTHTVREGRKLLRIFSVTDGPPSAPEDGNAFTLAFDPEECRWRMWEGE